MIKEEVLGLWGITKKDKCVPLSYDQLCREINKYFSDTIPYKLINELEEDGYIETTPRGDRVLTAKGLKDRIPIKKESKINDVGNDAAWLKFRRLCKYYIDCVHHSEKTQEFLYLNDLNNKFLLPTMPIDWLQMDEQYFKVNTTPKQNVALNRIKSRKDEDEDVYIGYPLSAFRSARGDTIYSPVFLIPVDIKYDILDLELKTRCEEISINQKWLEYTLKKAEHLSFIEGVCFCEGDTKGLIDINLALQYISNKFNIELNPNYLALSLSAKQRGIINSAALFIGDGLKYSKTLKKELNRISNEPSHILDQTSLAYVFREPPLPNEYTNSNDVPYDFISSNTEQRKALSDALNKPATKVTGPPGTGKSQVAVNLIANLVYRDKSVLFTSKNHKAIHAIYEKCQSASSTLPLIQFCSKPDGTSGSIWYSQDVESLIGNYVSIKDGLPFQTYNSVEKVLDAEEEWKEYISDIQTHELIRKNMAEINASLEIILDKIEVSENEINKYDVEHLRTLVSRLDTSGDNLSLWKKIYRFLIGAKRSRAAENQLRTLLPQISSVCRSNIMLQKRVNRLCGQITDYYRLIEQTEDLYSQCQSAPYEPILERLTKIYSAIHDNLNDAFICKRTNIVCSMESDIIDNLKNATTILRRENLPFLQQLIDEKTLKIAQDAFVQFSKFFPAWACTLLSLTKAAPCVAGLFDRVIIDESSQCEIPPMIPALFRSKGVTLIGDPNQFPPVITMRARRHAYLLNKHKLLDYEDGRYDFIHYSAYDMLTTDSIMLREHFRCNADVANYFNEAYYGGKLKVRTNQEMLKFPSNMGFKHGVEWRDISNSIEDEINEVKLLFDSLVRNSYSGTIGVITPFREIANNIATQLNCYTSRLEQFDIKNDVNTANGFQGGERDLIIFVLALTDQLSKGQEWYALAPENRYIYNVAASRARACLIVIGDRQRALNSDLDVLRKLAQPLKRSIETFQSPWEKILYDALVEKGFKPKPQYALAGRYLDLALEEYKIDIEVDGQAYHLNRFGERKQDDIYRDIIIASCGWKVIRFWVNELKDDMDDCIKQIRKKIDCH